MFNDVRSAVTAVEKGFGPGKVLVIGDVMLDRYLWGKVDRISPEAPVPVVHVQQASDAAGGAGNVALNLSSLACSVLICGIVGQDPEGQVLLDILRKHQIPIGGIVTSPRRSTTVKTRIIGGHQQMLRLDKEDAAAISGECLKDLVCAIDKQFEERPSVVILSDYGKGLVSSELCRHVIEKANALRIPVLVDPKGYDYTKYAGATAICPNRGELARVVAAPVEDLARLFVLAQQLRTKVEVDYIVLTLSELGIALIGEGGVLDFPALAHEVFDVSGAGDTVIAVLAASMKAGLPLHDSIRLANLAAGIVVGKLGTVPVAREELLAAVMLPAQQGSEKCMSLPGILGKVAKWRSAGDRIVFTNGCFDILHAGHITLLDRAHSAGDRLIVGLNTDRSVAALKGPTRPVISELERARVLSALSSVDAVVLFDEETPLNLIKALRPHVLVKGGDYAADEIVGAKDVQQWGGQVLIVPLVEGLSSSEILRKAAVRSVSSEVAAAGT